METGASKPQVHVINLKSTPNTGNTGTSTVSGFVHQDSVEHIKRVIRARRIAYQITGDILAREVENGCDGHPAWDSIVGDEELWNMVQAILEAMVKSLQDAAKAP